jgi:hypothetical protein
MRRGMSAGEFFLEYSPFVSLADGACMGGEALARWRRPSGVAGNQPVAPRALMHQQQPIGPALHTYWCDDYEGNVGYRHALLQTSSAEVSCRDDWESEWCMTTHPEAFARAWTSLQLPTDKRDTFAAILAAIPAKDTILTRKADAQGRATVLLQWCGISTSAFLAFLAVRAYPSALVEFCTAQAAQLEGLSHEIGELWRVDPPMFLRSAFYGNL